MANTRLQARWPSRGCLAQAAVLGVALVCVPPLAGTAQQAVPAHATAEPSISGQVRDAAGHPVGGAVVTLDTGMEAGKGTAPLHTLTDAGGSFIFRHPPRRSYAVHAEKDTLRSRATTVDFADGAAREISLVLDSKGDSASAGSAAQAMEFSDKPNFTVAGVTDWTAVGGHGSDVTLRTSEDLARQTLDLKTAGTSPKTADTAAEKPLLDAWKAAPQSYAANRDLGSFYLRASLYGKAVPLLQTASRLHGATGEDEYQVALACEGVGDNMAARLHLQKALLQQDRADFHRLASRVEERLGDPLASVRESARATQLEPSEENYFTWGSELLLHRAVWQAVEVFRNGAKAHPASARLKTAWGSALFAGGLYDEAAQRLCEASDLDPAGREPYLFMGEAALASPSPLPGVEQRLARFAKMQPDSPDANYLYAMALVRRTGQPDTQRAEALLTRAVALNPGYADASLQLGILAFAQHRYPDAIRFYQRAIASGPKQAEAHYRLAVAYDRTGEAAKATQERQLHDAIEKADADDIERKRREVKQFLVVLQGQPGTATP